MPSASSTAAGTTETEARLSPRPWSQIVESIPQNRLSSASVTPVAVIVAAVSALAITVAAHLYAQAGTEVSSDQVRAVAVLFVFGLLAQILTYRQAAGMAGSVATIPYAASAILVPGISSVFAAGLASAIVQRYHRRPALKATFNVAQTVLSTGAAVSCFRLLGGRGLLELESHSLLEILRVEVLPTIAMIGVLVLVNGITVSAVVSVSERVSPVRMLKSHLASFLPFLGLTLLFALYLAWLYAKAGPVGAIGLSLPIIAVRQLYRTTIELTNVSEELLDLMVAAIDARDPYTSGHSKRVSKAAKTIAKALGLTAREVERVGVAALLHDIGKIDKAFSSILTKEGRLTPEEWELMKRHPIRSAELVGLVSTLRDVVDGVRHHHERWDGTGYPDGISGQDIPLASRIIVFADTLDAMTTDRPYRRALDIQEARAELIRFRDKQFDPAICDRILAADVWPEVYACFEENIRHEARAQAS